jgi:hypothetical protein
MRRQDHLGAGLAYYRKLRAFVDQAAFGPEDCRKLI